jgi:hypothetical protein
MTPAARRAGTIVSVNTSVKKGQVKRPVASAELRAGRGIEGDAHEYFGHRQVSLLAVEDIEARRNGPAPRQSRSGRRVRENLTRGHRPRRLAIGDELVAGAVRLRSADGDCHTKCAIFTSSATASPARSIFCELQATARSAEQH